MRLLIVEDNERLATLVARLLSEQAFAVDTVASVDAALAALDVASYDLVLLDLALPDGEGADVLRTIRGRGHGTPVLVATARGEVEQRVRMLDLGADDYLVKPFSFDELLARVRALLRRPRQITDPVLIAGNVTLDTAAMTLSVDGQPVEAPRRELGVLAALMRSQGRLLPRQKLAEFGLFVRQRGDAERDRGRGLPLAPQAGNPRRRRDHHRHARPGIHPCTNPAPGCPLDGRCSASWCCARCSCRCPPASR